MRSAQLIGYTGLHSSSVCSASFREEFFSETQGIRRAGKGDVLAGHRCRRNPVSHRVDIPGHRRRRALRDGLAGRRRAVLSLLLGPLSSRRLIVNSKQKREGGGRQERAQTELQLTADAKDSVVGATRIRLFLCSLYYVRAQ